MNKQLNILEMMGYRRAHSHFSTDSLNSSDIVLPQVDSYRQYDTPTITRVINQLASNSERIITHIRDNFDGIGAANLENYITTNSSDEDGQNKIFVSPPATMTSQRTLALQQSTDLQILNMPELIASFMMESYPDKKPILIGITKNDIVKFDLSITNPTQLYLIDPLRKEEERAAYVSKYGQSIANVEFKRAGYADENKLFIYVITNFDIRLYKVSEIRSSNLLAGSLWYSNIVDFKDSFTDNHKRYDDNLVIDDIRRRQKIIDLINDGNFDEFTDKYFKLGNFPTNPLNNYQNYDIEDAKPILVNDIGLISGKYGLYQIQCYSAKSTSLNEFEIDNDKGSLHIRCIDNKPIKNAFFYRDKGELFLVAINGWPKSDSQYTLAKDNAYKGLTVFKIDKNSSASKIYTMGSGGPTIVTRETSATQLNPNGYITFKKSKINVNQVLNAKGINGAYVNNITWQGVKVKIKGVTSYGILIKDSTRSNDTDGKNGWFIGLNDKQLSYVNKVYDRYEFNCLAECKINDATYYDSQETILLDIKDLGLVEGNKTVDKQNKTGFRFKILKKSSEYEKLNQLIIMNRCFVGISNTKLYFVTTSGDFNILDIKYDLSTVIQQISYATTYESSNIVCLIDGTKIALVYLKYKVDTTKYTNLITGNLIENITSKFVSSNNIISKKIEEHIKEDHNSNSVITKLNNLLKEVKGRTITESTGYSDNNHMSYIILNYPNSGDDFEFVTTDENSTDIYGKINSKTVNANLALTTQTKRNSDDITFYDTVTDSNGETIIDSNILTYSVCRISDLMTKLTVNVPTTGTYYVDNIAGWSNGNRTGSALIRKNLDGGYLLGQIEQCTTNYKLIINRRYFNIKNIINVTAQIASAPLAIYSNRENYDVRHYGMYDSPILNVLNLNSLDDTLAYDISDNANDEIALDFSIFGGDAITINILIQNY